MWEQAGDDKAHWEFSSCQISSTSWFVCRSERAPWTRPLLVAIPIPGDREGPRSAFTEDMLEIWWRCWMQHTRCSPGERASACDLASDVEFMLFQFEFRTHLSRCENRNISVRLHKSLFLSQLMATFAFIYPLSIQFSAPPLQSLQTTCSKRERKSLLWQLWRFWMVMVSKLRLFKMGRNFPGDVLTCESPAIW